MPECKNAAPMLGEVCLMIAKKLVIDFDQLPKDFPTHLHTSEFWEALGRTVATFGFLEEILGKAIFAITVSKNSTTEELDFRYSKWVPIFESALTDQLYKLAESYGKSAKTHQEFKSESQSIQALVDDIKKSRLYSECYLPRFVASTRRRREINTTICKYEKRSL